IPRTEDGRVLFAIPWQHRTLVGTTDTPVQETSLEPRPLEDEIEFLLRHTGRYLTREPAGSEILSAFAGLRPLVNKIEAENTAGLSRAHTLLVSAAGLVTIAGGKWTTYRQMGEDTVNEAERVAGLVARPSRTRSLALHGRQVAGHEAWHWAPYGADAGKLRAALLENADRSKLLHANLPYV